MKQLIHLVTTVFVISMVVVSCGDEEGNADPDLQLNDNGAPTINTQNFNVSASTEPKTIIANIVASDPDEDELTYSIVENVDELFFITDAGALSLSEGKSLDAEDSAYVITVAVTDQKLTAQAKVTISVIAEDKNAAPVIEEQEFSVLDSIEDDVEIGTVTATDDEELSYKIITNDNDLFEISNEGVLSLADGKKLSFKESEEHVIVVEVTDGELTAQAEITIEVTDGYVNAAPSIEDQSFEVAEDATEIGTIEATDIEPITFSITTNSEDLFVISDEGVLSLADDKTLDYETATVHEIEVEVSDGELSETATITINVTNVLEIMVSTFNASEAKGIAVHPITGDVYTASNESTRVDVTTPEGETQVFASHDTYLKDCRVMDVASSGTLYISEMSSSSHIVFSVTEDAVINPGRRAVPSPHGLAVDEAENIYVSSSTNHMISKKLSSGFTYDVVAGGEGTLGFVDGNGTEARFNAPRGIDLDISGNLYVADAGNHSIRKVTPGGVVTTIAGNGEAGYADGTGSEARFNNPEDVVVDDLGNIYVADRGNYRVRKIDTNGVVTTIAGNGQRGIVDGIGAEASFHWPYRIDISPDGKTLYIANGSEICQKITMY